MFKIGDKVKCIKSCIDRSNRAMLRAGDTCRILDVQDHACGQMVHVGFKTGIGSVCSECGMLVGKPGQWWHKASRFELIKSDNITASATVKGIDVVFNSDKHIWETKCGIEMYKGLLVPKNAAKDGYDCGIDCFDVECQDCILSKIINSEAPAILKDYLATKKQSVERDFGMQIPDDCDAKIEDGVVIITKKEEKKEVVYPKSVEELADNDGLFYISPKGSICGLNTPCKDENSIETKEMAEAFLALMQLIRLKDAWNELCDGEFDEGCVYIITKQSKLSGKKLYTSTSDIGDYTLEFKTELLRDNFGIEFKDLIGTAYPLL